MATSGAHTIYLYFLGPLTVGCDASHAENPAPLLPPRHNNKSLHPGREAGPHRSGRRARHRSSGGHPVNDAGMRRDSANLSKSFDGSGDTDHRL